MKKRVNYKGDNENNTDDGDRFSTTKYSLQGVQVIAKSRPAESRQKGVIFTLRKSLLTRHKGEQRNEPGYQVVIHKFHIIFCRVEVLYIAIIQRTHCRVIEKIETPYVCLVDWWWAIAGSDGC